MTVPQSAKTIVLLAMVLALSAGADCRLRPEAPDPPLGGPDAPPLPEAIDQEQDGQEPRLRVYVSETGAISEMPFEEYIEGVVAAEMNPEWHENALAAQAIIARSFTLQKIAEDGGVPERGAHASTDIEEFQAYDADRINDRVRQAVAATRGQVAVHQGEFIRGWFHAFAGPRTALADEGLEFAGGNPPYIQIVSSPGKDIVPAEEGDWSESFPLSQIREAVTEITGDDPGPVEEVSITDKGPSGRVTMFRVNDVEVSAPKLRLALDSTVMRSTFIEELEVEGSNLTMSGSGYGHGVGMCQWGARSLAEDNWSCREIVEYFYRDIEIVKVWD